MSAAFLSSGMWGRPSSVRQWPGSVSSRPTSVGKWPGCMGPGGSVGQRRGERDSDQHQHRLVEVALTKILRRTSDSPDKEGESSLLRFSELTGRDPLL